MKAEIIKTNIKKEKFLEMFEKTKGNIYYSAKAVPITRTTYYSWLKKDKKFAQSATEIIEGAGDFVESKLLQRIHDDSDAAIIFYCKTKLKDRGYVERIENTGKDGEKLIPPSMVTMTAENLKMIAEAINNEF